MKYIILKNGDVLLFSRNVNHNSMAEAKDVASAGFVKIHEGKVLAYGESLTLDIGSRQGDDEIIDSQMRSSDVSWNA